MEAARIRGELKELIESDLAFHLALAEASGIPILVEMLQRLLRPLFAFVLLRVREKHATLAWAPDLTRHREMINLIRGSNPAIAGQFAQHCVGRFLGSAQAVWWPDAPGKRRRKTPAKTP